jgi:hypothetical protein
LKKWVYKWYSIGKGPPFQPRQEPTLSMPVLGFRSWSQVFLWPEGNGGFDAFLKPNVFQATDYKWQLTGVNQAECMEFGLPIDKVPCPLFQAGHCNCGLYAMKRFMVVPSAPRIGWIPFGIILGWGQMLEHHQGFRVTKAKILCLFDQQDFLRTTVNELKSPVPIFDWADMKRAMDFAKQHGDFL